MVDISRSIRKRNVRDVALFLQKLVDKFHFSENGTHASLETFSFISTLHNKFSDTYYHSKSNFQQLIDRTIYRLRRLSLPTRLDLALKKADEEMFTFENGNRPGVQSVLVIFTDGRTFRRYRKPHNYMPAVRDLKVRQP